MIAKTISHYRILEKLGGGGMGVVYKAEDIKLKRTVALKFLPPDLTRDEEAKERFIHEAQAASALDHPNICTIYEIDETEDGQMFIAMAYYEGETLKKKVASNQLSVNSVIDYAIQIAQGLAKAHEHGITHRDIKPANVMVTKDGVVKIVDFGLAKLAGQKRLTKTGMTVGTIAYMSPEQAQSIDADHRSDIWSFGVVLYEMLTGQLPFKGEYEQAVVYSILNEDAEPITGLRTGVPMELERIVDKAMAKRPDERYQRVDEMLVDLKRVSKEAETGKVKVRPAKEKLHPRERAIRYGRWAGLALLLAIAGLFLWQKVGERTSTRSDSRPKIRLAVLPFDNITKNPEDEYFSDGMTDEMISKLSKISGFGVIARTSVMQYKTAPKSIADIGQELRVSKVLEGSVRKAMDKLRISVKLVDVATQEQIWSDEYDKEFADVFAVQNEVAQQVASALRVELSPTEKRQIEKRGTESLEAYNLYLQGMYYINKFTPEGPLKGIEFFNQAIKIDPEFAHVYAGLARAYGILDNSAFRPPLEVGPKRKAYALRALEIDPTLSEAYAELAAFLFGFDWDWEAAENTLKKALEFKPPAVTARLHYAIFLSALGRHDEALAEIRLAQELNPVDLVSHSGEGIYLFLARRYDEAIKQFNETIAMDPNFPIPYVWSALTYIEKGMVDEALVAGEKYTVLTGGSGLGVAVQGYIYARAGRRSEAQNIVEQLVQYSKQRYVPAIVVALIYAGLGETDLALEWLEKAYEQRDPQMFRIKVVPSFDPLRSDPRFIALLKKMGLEK
jgi:serine/threonine-protein kinase